MKKLSIILSFVLIVLYGNSQTATYEEVISKKKKGKIVEYISKNGEVFKVGDTLILGIPFRNENYDYILQSFGGMTYPLTNTASGSDIIIKKIKVYSKSVYVYTTKPQGAAYGLLINNFEGAIEQDEIKTTFLTVEEAISKLKLEKDKLDLGVITQEEYDKKKAELMKYIK